MYLYVGHKITTKMKQLVLPKSIKNPSQPLNTPPIPLWKGKENEGKKYPLPTHPNPPHLKTTPIDH
jgi:hypothetical protein